MLTNTEKNDILNWVILMPRKARIKSESGIYHIILRGINQQQIFEDNEDSEKFIRVLKDCKAISGFKIFAYCLMGNHIHLLIKSEIEPLAQIFKRIGSRYVYWYNWKYYRTGHLFQDRFKSEPINDDDYFLTVLRYIHQNPVKANLCKSVKDYPFSSINSYINNNNDFIDVDFVFNIINQDSLLTYFEEDNNDSCLDLSKCTNRVNDIDAKIIIKSICGCSNVSEFQKLEQSKQISSIREFKQRGLSIRQISRLTGVSFNVVRKY